MRPNYKEQPLKEEINDPAGDSSKLTKRNQNLKKLANKIKLAGDVDPFVKTDLNANRQQSEEEMQSKQKLVDYNSKVIERVSNIFEEEIRNNVSQNEPYSDEWYEDETTRKNVSNAFEKLESIKSSMPKRVHDRTQTLLVAEQLENKRKEVESFFLQKYGKTPEQLIQENADVPTKPGESFEDNVPLPTKELLEARTIIDLKNLSEQLRSDDIDEDYWNDIKWKKDFTESLTPKFITGLTRDLYRSVMEGIGAPSIGLPMTPEGRQHAINNIYEYNFSQLPDDSFLKQAFKPEDVKSMLDFTLMSKLPMERPWLIEAMKSVTSSLAALPMYMTGLSRLGLITKTGESGLFQMGAREFGKQLLKAPFYTQPFRLATDSINAMNDAKDYGDVFAGLGKAYLNGLAEVMGEVSTPIFAKGLGKVKLWNKLTDSIESRLLNVGNKFNLNLKTAIDWTLISPVTETFEEEISNALNFDPSIFTGDFDLKRLSLEAVSSLGMGIPIGIVSSITRKKLEDSLIENLPDQYKNDQTVINQLLDEYTNKITEFANNKLTTTPELREKLDEYKLQAEELITFSPEDIFNAVFDEAKEKDQLTDLTYENILELSGEPLDLTDLEIQKYQEIYSHIQKDPFYVSDKPYNPKGLKSAIQNDELLIGESESVNSFLESVESKETLSQDEIETLELLKDRYGVLPFYSQNLSNKEDRLEIIQEIKKNAIIDNPSYLESFQKIQSFPTGERAILGNIARTDKEIWAALKYDIAQLENAYPEDFYSIASKSFVGYNSSGLLTQNMASLIEIEKSKLRSKFQAFQQNKINHKNNLREINAVQEELGDEYYSHIGAEKKFFKNVSEQYVKELITISKKLNKLEAIFSVIIQPGFIQKYHDAVEKQEKRISEFAQRFKSQYPKLVEYFESTEYSTFYQATILEETIQNALLSKWFHGTGTFFKEFSDEKMLQGEGVHAFGPGHYLTQEFDTAKMYRTNQVHRDKVNKGYINVTRVFANKNPKLLLYDSVVNTEDALKFAEAFPDLIQQASSNWRFSDNLRITGSALIEFLRPKFQNNPAKFKSFLQYYGYDGVLYSHGSIRGQKEVTKFNVVVFDPKDITVEKIYIYNKTNKGDFKFDSSFVPLPPVLVSSTLTDEQIEFRGVQPISYQPPALQNPVKNVVFQDNDIKAINANSVDILKNTPDNAYDIVFTDPPYGINWKYPEFNDSRESVKQLIDNFLPEARRVAKTVVLTPGFLGEELYPTPDYKFEWYDEGNGKRQDIYVYGQLTKEKQQQVKDYIAYSKTLADFKERYSEQNPEHLKGRINQLKELQKLKEAGDPKLQNRDFEHYIEKYENKLKWAMNIPVKPARFWTGLLQVFTEKGQKVFDPFLGGGSTLFSAKKLGLKATGVDISPKTLEFAKMLYDKYFGDIDKQDLMSYEQVKNDNPFIFDNIVIPLEKEGLVLTGSLALSKKGTVYRKNQIPHDLDFRIDKSFLEQNNFTFEKLGQWLNEKTGLTFKPYKKFERTNFHLYQYTFDYNGDEVIVDIFPVDQAAVETDAVFQEKFRAGRLKDIKDFYNFQQIDAVQPNLDVTVSNQSGIIDDAPNQDHNDKASQQEEKQNVSVQMSINGMVAKLLNKGINLKVYGLETPEKLWNYIQSFKTGNHELDWMKFEVDWLQKFGDTLSQPIPNSSRTLLQDLFITNYFATKKKAVQLKIGKDGKIQVANLTGNAYVDADNKSKSLIGQEELWEKIQGVLPDGTAVYSINLIERSDGSRTTKYNNFGDIKDKNNPIDFNAIRIELLKQGYVWSGLFPGSNTSLVVDVKSLLPDFKDVPLEEAHSTLWNMMFDALLGEGLDPLTKIKRSKATTGESPSSYIFPETKTLLDKTTPASSIYISEENGKTKLNYKYVVINSDTIPKDFESELGDGEEYVTPFFAKIYYSINGTPYLKRGAMKPKFFDIGKFWKWARKIRKPQSKLDYFMKKNNIAGVVFSSVQKVGKDANMIDWKQLDTMQDVTDFVYEHDMLQDSDLFDKGKISKKAAGAGPNFATTGILNFMSKQGKDDTLKWLERDFQETQEYVDKLIQNPEFFEKEVQDYVANMDYEDDIVNFIKSSQGSPYLLRHPSVTDFLMKGYLKDQLFEAARHYKRGSSPALVLDIGGNIGYKSIEGSNQEAFDDKGFLKDNYILIDYFTAKKLNYKVGDKVIVALNPPGAPVDIRAIEIAGILPQEIGANQVVASVRQFQDWSGKDGDIDTLNVLSVKDELDVKVWQHIKNADMDNRFAKMMKDFESVNRAKLIVKTLYGREATEKEIQSWKRIAPLVKLDGDDKGVFALNMNFATIDFKNKDDWNGIQKLSHEGLIGQLYNWKAIYTLFLENDYELNGVRANKDIEFILPMLKQLTDMALDWTKTLDIAKIQFNWDDMVKRLFSFPDKYTVEQFNKDLRPIRQAFSLITQRDKTLEKYDYIKYHQAIQQIRKELAKLPPGLGRSILGITTRGLDAIQLPKLALTRPQFTNVTDNLKSVFLNVDKENIKNAQQVHIGLVNNSGLGQALNVTKALSRLGTNTNNPQDEVANINILKQETISRRQARAGNPEIVNTPLYDIYFTWLDGVMETPIAKQDGEVEIGKKIKNGYRYKITSINGETSYQILSYSNNQITDTQAFTDWNVFRKEAGINFEGLSLTNEFNEVFWNLISTNNQVVKNVSDNLLKQVFPRIVETPGFQKAGKDIKQAFTYGVLGLLDSNDWGLQVSDKPGLRNPIGDKTFIKPDKASITSWAKPITYLENFAWRDDVILETVIRFKKTLNTLIEQEVEKEKDLSRNASKIVPSSFVPLPILDSKKITLSDVMKLIPYQMTQDEAQVWVDKLLNENIISDNDRKIFEKVVLKGLKQADIKYGFKWRAALDFNPLTSLFINSHNIPFDVFIDLFGKKNKLYSANQVVYSFPINGKMFDVTSNEIDIKFKHWNLRTKANLISNAQVWWYVQDALDRHYEKSRINYEEQVASVTEFALAKDMELDKDIRWTYTDVKIFQDKTMLEAFELAEDDNFKTAISGFDLNSDKKTYFDFAKSKMDKPTPKQVRRYVAAMRYRYLFDNLVESAILKQVTNMQLIQDIAIKGNNLSAYTMAQGFIEQLETMTKQVRGINAYMPHTWDSKDFWMQARKDIYIEQGKSEQEALKRAKKDWEDKEARNAHIGGLGNYVDTFFLTREANMKGYNKTPNAANMYFNQLNRMFRFQHLFAMEELADEMLQDEIPFLKSHAKQMSAILRGADKYGVRVDISDLKPNQLVLFNETTQDGIKLVQGKVKEATKTYLTLENGETISRNQITGLKRLYGVSLETKARIALNKLGINANTDKQRLPTMMQYILKLQANSMLTGNTFAVRNVLGGMLQEFVYFGNEVQAKAETFMKNVGIDKISSGELTDEQKEQFELIYDNSIALLGNLDEIMGKFGGMISVLNEVEGLPKEIVTNIVLLQKKHNRVKVDAAEYGIDTKFRIENGKMHGAMIEKIWKHYQTAVKLLNINPMGVFGRFQNVSWINPASGEKWLRFHTAISAIEAHRGLDITDPYQKRILIAYIDQAIRNTQFLYRVGIDQGILESSPTARALYSNYQHYPMSSFTTTWYYIDNMLKQNKEYKGRLIDFIDTDEYKARFGKGSKMNYMVINQGTPEEEVIQYADINYGRVVARNVTVGFALKLLDIGGKVFQQRLRYAGLPLIVDSLAYFADITSTSYVTTPMATAIFEMVSYFGSLMMNPKDDEKWLKSIKNALYQSREDYMKDVRDKEWADDVSDKVINSVYTQNLIREILEKIPLGVQQRNMIDALTVSLLFGITPDAYQEIGVNVANQIFPIRLLRNPMLGSILGDEYAQPLTIGYNKLHTARLKYEQKKRMEKKEQVEDEIIQDEVIEDEKVTDN